MPYLELRAVLDDKALLFAEVRAAELLYLGEVPLAVFIFDLLRSAAFLLLFVATAFLL